MKMNRRHNSNMAVSDAEVEVSGIVEAVADMIQTVAVE
jgi:hypothetical protein